MCVACVRKSQGVPWPPYTCEISGLGKKVTWEREKEKRERKERKKREKAGERGESCMFGSVSCEGLIDIVREGERERERESVSERKGLHSSPVDLGIVMLSLLDCNSLAI